MATPQEQQHVPDTLCTEAIISKIPAGVTEDHLTNFLECTLPDCHVEHVQFKKKGAALVTFENGIDLRVLQTRCENDLLEGQVLVIHPVDQRGAVLIHSPCSRTATNSFKYYLNNKKRSGGSGTEHIHRDENNLFLIAYYHSRKEAEQVAQRKHTLENQELRLEFFDPNFDEFPDSVTPSTEYESLISLQSSTDFTQSVGTYNCSAAVPDMGTVGYRNKHEEITKESQDATVHERRRQYSIRDVSGLCLVYQKVLDVFISTIPKQQLDIQIEMEHGGFRIQGEDHEVEKAETLIHCLCEKQESSEFVNGKAAVFSGWDEVFDQLQVHVDRGEYSLVIQEGAFGVEEFCIQLIYDDQCLSFDDFLGKFVSWKTVAVKSKGAEELLRTTAWNGFQENDMERKFGNQVMCIYYEKDHRIEVIGNVEVLDEAVNFVEVFLMNIHDEQQFRLGTTEKDILQKFWLRGSSSVQTGTDVDFAEVLIEGHCLSISGNRAGVRREVEKFQMFRRNLQSKRAIFIHPKLATFQQQNGDLWRDIVKNTATENRCLITDLPDPRIPDADDDHDDWGQWVAAVIHSFTLPGQPLKLHVVEGKTEDLKVDAVVVCSESNTFQEPSIPQAQGARPKSYSRDQEHRTLMQQTEGIHVTQPGARPGKALVQVSLQYYFSSTASTPLKATMDRLIADLFEVCDCYHFGSMALPLFGVDVSESPKPIDVAIGILTKTITDYCCHEGRPEGHQGSSSLKQLFLCSPRAACLHALTYALHDDLAWQKSSPTPQTFNFLSADMPKPRTKALHSGAIEIQKGDISRAQVDALVVPCDIDIDLDLHKSQVTKSLLRGGSEVQSSLQRGGMFFNVDKTEERNEELAEHRNLTGRSGTLNARHIFYVFLPPWGPNAKQMLIECVQKSLREATNKGYRRVALTSLGVGKLDYPPMYAARTALSAVSQFMGRETTSLRNVQFVIFDQATFEIYQEELWGWQKQIVSYGGSDVAPLTYPHHTVPASSPLTYPYHTVPAQSVPSYGSSTDPIPTRSSHTPGYAVSYPNVMKIHDIKLRIKIGNIARENCDVIVNSTNGEFDFVKGGVSRAIERCAGSFLVSICHQKKNVKALKNSGMVVTDAPGLPGCSAILHLDVERFRQKPKETLLKCFTTLLDKRPSTQTVAFPALGSGASRLNSPEHSVQTMKEALQDLKKPKQLQEVRVVVSNGEMFQRLVACLDTQTKRRASPPPSSPSKPPSMPRPQSIGAAAAASTGSAPSHSSRVLVTKVPRSKWADRNALSLFIVSDKEENWQKACSKLAEELESCLGPVTDEPPRAEDKRPGMGYKDDGDDPQRGCFPPLLDWIT